MVEAKEIWDSLGQQMCAQRPLSEIRTVHEKALEAS